MSGIISWEQYLLASLLILLLYYLVILVGFPGKTPRRFKKKRPLQQPETESDPEGMEHPPEEAPASSENIGGVHYFLIREMTESLERLMLDAKVRGFSKETFLRALVETFGEYPETKNTVIPSAILHYVRLNAERIPGIPLSEPEIEEAWKHREPAP